MDGNRTGRGARSGRDDRPSGPGGYAAWVAWIDAFRRGDDRSAEGLPAIDGRMGTYVEARLLERLSLAFSERVRAWQTALGDRIVASPPADDAAVAEVLRDARPGLEPLARVASSPLVPRPMSVAMHDLLAEVRAGARDAVTESARRVREPEVQPRLPRVDRQPRVTSIPGPAAAAVVPGQRAPGAIGTQRPAARATSAPRVG